MNMILDWLIVAFFGLQMAVLIRHGGTNLKCKDRVPAESVIGDWIATLIVLAISFAMLWQHLCNMGFGVAQ